MQHLFYLTGFLIALFGTITFIIILIAMLRDYKKSRELEDLFCSFFMLAFTTFMSGITLYFLISEIQLIF